ncbi:Na+-driven multidrug efflux pump [Bradyrhizobium diazoefficiens]|uniref:Cation efflux system protein n=3 Tax=Nitrobacteraceae TaxID=41294 RepID=A0A0E4BLQ8_9BRAD|nr:cation efflux system protein [Bradyrhizobium diazoefficiens]
MVGVNMGAGQTARARRIGWISGIVGMVMTGTIGLLVAIFPTAWLNLFSRDAEVVSEGMTYLRIVAPAYAALGFGFVTSFAAQGTGRAMGPLASSIARILIAAGGGWIAVASFGAGMAGLATMVAVALAAYAAICALVMLSPSTWRSE